MHKNEIKIQWGVIFLWFEGENLAIFPRFQPKTVAKSAIFEPDIGDFPLKTSGNTRLLVRILRVYITNTILFNFLKPLFLT